MSKKGRTQPRNLCIFGDGRTAVAEHVFGQWTAKYLPTDGTYVLAPGIAQPGERTPAAGTLAGIYQPRIVCQKCNSTWLGLIEQRAEDAGLGVMIRPQRGDVSLTIDLDQQRAIATWASKVALMTPYLYRHPEWVWPPHLTAFRYADRSPDDFAVWLGTYAGTGPYSSIQPGRVRDAPIPGRTVTFYLGHALFQVFLGEGGSPYTSRSPDMTSSRDGQAVVLRLWPPRDAPIAWPTVAVDLAVFTHLSGFAPAAVPL